MDLKNLIIDTLKSEVVPAIGCTEPVAVALACAKAKDIIDYNELKKVEVLVSPNIYKNGLGVGIPNTDLVGLNIAAALGVIGGDSKKNLSVLDGISKDQVNLAKDLLEKDLLALKIKDTDKKIYVEVNLYGDNKLSKVIIENKHNNFTYIQSDGDILLNKSSDIKNLSTSSNKLFDTTIIDLIKEIEDIDCNELQFLLDGFVMNEKIAEEGLKKKLGIGVGYGFHESMKKGLLSDDLINTAMMLTAAGSDARMSGLTMPVMSSNGSGNNGLTAILPIVAYKRKFDANDDKIVKALAISHTINCYIKNYIGRLSALCGCGIASATGASASIAWLMGGNYNQIEGAIQNMIANLSGMICDGAKVGCALKLATAASSAIQSAILALNDSITFAKNGIVAEKVEDTILNLGTLSSKGMDTTDKVILDIMKEMA
ncbi:serine dehydratase subunit alpha family protein [Dethiothermospora halolimnae]|uniref:L-cysteine desulfidase family protein n=1 Tax=Dethiothermospora halolimnae TaxID=3114390 RepID=UPI003CCBD3E7